MNQTHTPKRNALQIKTIRDLLFVKLNRLPLEYFPAEHYAALWIKERRHFATESPIGRAAKTAILEHHHSRTSSQAVLAVACRSDAVAVLIGFRLMYSYVMPGEYYEQ